MEAESDSGSLVIMDLGQLTPADVAVLQPGAGVTVEPRSDDRGNYVRIKFTRGAQAPQWTATRIALPQLVFPNGAEWAELEMWSSGAPLRIVADARDQKTECFELVFCHPDVSWNGWKSFRTSLRTGSDNLGGGQLVPHTIINPLRIKYLLVIMRQGQDWELGIRNLIIRVDRE